MFIAALYIIAKVWKQPKCLSVDEWIKKIWNEYYSALKKEGNPVICDNMDEPGEHYAKRNKPDREILHGITYMWNQK